MNRFIFGSDEQFRIMDKELSKGKKYKYINCNLPSSCKPKTACLSFGKKNGLYIICIDKGIITTENNKNFKKLIKNGECSFTTIHDMVVFLQSLKALFPEENLHEETHNRNSEYEINQYKYNDKEHFKEKKNECNLDVIDRKLLEEIQKNSDRIINVWPDELATLLKKKIFGQDEVIDALSEKIVMNNIRKDKKLLTITFLGPTGSGKSETAKSLAKIMTQLYNKDYGYIEIAGNEFIGEHTIHRFFGAPPGYIGHGSPTILEPIRKNPYHIIVINEIEKADNKILIALMEAIDTGILGMADNSKSIDLNRCIMLFTSNISVNMQKYESSSDFERSEMCRDIFTKACGRPEISGKIGNFLVFKSLSEDALTNIVIKFICEELENYGLELGYIDEYLMIDFLKIRTKYGARGIRALVNESIGKNLLRTRMLRNIKEKKIFLKGTIDNVEFQYIKEG